MPGWCGHSSGTEQVNLEGPKLLRVYRFMALQEHPGWGTLPNNSNMGEKQSMP